jgi:ferredoxin--NADP+ reductase
MLHRSSRSKAAVASPATSAAPDPFLRARITQRTEISDDLWSIRVDPGGPFSFAAGQYATLGLVSSGGRRIERAYSIVSSPYESELEFFVERVHEGELTPLLYGLTVGDTLSLRKAAKGRFLFDVTTTRRDRLLLCTVTGVAPFISFVRTLERDWREGKFKGDQRLFLIQGASRSAEFGYRDEIERVAAQVPWLTYVPTISRPWEDAGWSGESGRVDDVIRKYVDRWSLDAAHVTAYLCGHPEMIEHGKAILGRDRWATHDLRTESYFVPDLVH